MSPVTAGRVSGGGLPSAAGRRKALKRASRAKQALRKGLDKKTAALGRRLSIVAAVSPGCH